MYVNNRGRGYFYDGPGVTTQTHTPEEGCLCVVKRHTLSSNTKMQKHKNTKTKQNTKTQKMQKQKKNTKTKTLLA